MRERATIRDVAEAAGCSVSTVSRVLNDVGRVGAETRARVREAAKRLNFQFDPIGQSLKNRRTRTIGVMIPTLSNPVFADAVDGVHRAAREGGYHLLLACSNYDVSEETAAVSTLLAHRVDGLILTVADAETSPALELALSAGAPFTLIFNHPEQDLPAVAFDNRTAARGVAERMLALGHREAAFVAGRFNGSDRSRQRYLGFRETYLQATGREPAVLEVDYGARSHRAALAGMLAERPGLTALFCSNDMLALTVIGDLRALGRRAPEDLSVVGFDGIDVAAISEPSLATVATPCREMGAVAAQGLIAQCEENSELSDDAVRLLPFEFRPGRSLGRAPGGAADAEVATSTPASVPACDRTEN